MASLSRMLMDSLVACRCLDLTHSHARLRTPTAWDYLACTEIVHPIGANNQTDMRVASSRTPD